MNMKYIVLVFFFLLESYFVYSDPKCREGLVCDPNECHCIRVCKDNDYRNGYDTICVKSLSDVKAPQKPRIVDATELPICINFDYSTFPGSYEYYNPAEVMSEEGIREDIERVFREWNCLCDLEDVPCKTSISTGFCDDREIMGWKYANTAAIANTWAPFPNCIILPSGSSILINNTSYLRYRDQLEYHSADPWYSFINVKYEKNMAAIWEQYTCNFISFYHTLSHEYGHILGFMHPEDCKKTDKLDSRMHDKASVNKPSTGLSDYDKCGFMKFYCERLDIEELSQRPNIEVTPNPTTGELIINFEILEGIKPVSIQLCDEQGKVLTTLLSDVLYREGIHTYITQIKLQTGVYFILTTIGNTIYSNKIIVK